MDTIVHLTTVHNSFDIRIFYKECLSLVRFGYNVILIAPHNMNETVEGVSIIGIPKHTNRLKRMIIGLWQIYRKALSVDASLYHFHDPELIFVGLLLKLHGKKVIYDVHENTSKSILSKYWIPIWLRKPISFLVRYTEHFSALYFDKIIVATPSIGESFPKEKTSLVQNFPLNSEVQEHHINSNYKKRENNIIYVGGISAIRGAKEMIQAMQYCQHEDAELILVGGYTPKSLEKDLQNIDGWAKVKSYGWHSRNEVQKLMERARLAIILFHPEPNHLESQPNKIFEYMAAELPIVASDFPLWRNLIKQTNCGLLVNPLDPKKVAHAIDWLLANQEEAKAMGERGRKAVIEKFNWQEEEKKLIQAYEDVLGRA